MTALTGNGQFKRLKSAHYSFQLLATWKLFRNQGFGCWKAGSACRGMTQNLGIALRLLLRGGFPKLPLLLNDKQAVNVQARHRDVPRAVRVPGGQRLSLAGIR